MTTRHTGRRHAARQAARQAARGFASSLALLALPLVSITGTAATAQAAEPGSIQIVDQHNLATGGSVGIPEAVFTVSLVSGVDPTTQAGATQFRQYQALVEAGQSSQIPIQSQYDPTPTDSTGTTTVTDLPVGAYLIHETGVLTSAGKLTTPTDPVDDFLVALPTDDGSGSPVYNLVVMPKTDIGAPVPTPSPSTIPKTSVTPKASATPKASSTPTRGGTVHPSTPHSAATVTVQPPASKTAVTQTQPESQPETQYQNGGTSQNGSTSQVTSPNSTHINSGDGADFGGGVQWATIAFAVALIAVAFLATGRRRRGEKH